jgi:hypothetical protein
MLIHHQSNSETSLVLLLIPKDIAIVPSLPYALSILSPNDVTCPVLSRARDTHPN